MAFTIDELRTYVRRASPDVGEAEAFGIAASLVSREAIPPAETCEAFSGFCPGPNEAIEAILKQYLCAPRTPFPHLWDPERDGWICPQSVWPLADALEDVMRDHTMPDGGMSVAAAATENPTITSHQSLPIVTAIVNPAGIDPGTALAFSATEIHHYVTNVDFALESVLVEIRTRYPQPPAAVVNFIARLETFCVAVSKLKGSVMSQGADAAQVRTLGAEAEGCWQVLQSGVANNAALRIALETPLRLLREASAAMQRCSTITRAVASVAPRIAPVASSTSSAGASPAFFSVLRSGSPMRGVAVLEEGAAESDPRVRPLFIALAGVGIVIAALAVWLGWSADDDEKLRTASP